MDRRTVILSGLAAAGSVSACVTASPDPARAPQYPVDGSAPQGAGAPPPAFTTEELARAGSDFLGVAAESVAAAIERIAGEQRGARPTAYIAGEEASAALAVGARYGRGVLYMKTGTPPSEVFWQGPSVGWDVGGNAARVFTLIYGMQNPDQIFRRFPGVEGSAYLVGGLGVNYQAGDGMVLAPIRAGVGLRLGANVGYLAYSRQRNLLPF